MKPSSCGSLARLKITYITAGAGSMYCGSCIRDNALATALLARGHDVTLVPTYTPLTTDEPNVSQHRVFFGGISVYLEQYVSLFRKTPWLLDRLWEAPWLLRAVSGRGIQTAPGLLGELTLSMLQGEHGLQQKEFTKLVHWLRSQPKPDVIDISNSLLISLVRPLKEALGCPVCCTLQGENIFVDGLAEQYRTRVLELMRSQVAHVDAFLAVSESYAAYMSSYLGIPTKRMHVVPLGITLTGFEASRVPSSGPFTVGFFGRVTPEKGLHVLCEAYKRLRERGTLEGSRLEVAGYLAPEHEAYLESIVRQVREWGLEREMRYRGVLDRSQKIDFLKSCDLLAIPAIYEDPKGLALLEAMACGVPVVVPSRGTPAELARTTGGGLLVEPEDVESLAAGLLKIRTDPELARELGRRGTAGVREHYTSTLMADRALDVYGRLGTGSREL